MKKIALIIIITFFLLPMNIYAEKQNVEFSDCVDGDTAKVILKNEKVTLRFLAIDTPETKHPTKGKEAFGAEASQYTCSSLKNAKSIQIEYDDNSDILDKYNRHLVWIFIDGELFQEKLIQKGYAKIAYLYDDYKYTTSLEELENIAKKNQVGIWGDYKEDYTYIYLAIAIIVVMFLFSKTFRNKIIKKIKNKILKI